MAAAADLIVDNIWIAGDGRIARPGRILEAGGSAEPAWLLRNAGWVRVQRVRHVLRVEMDGRSAAARAVATALDVLRSSAERWPAAGQFETWIHDGTALERASFPDPIKACRHLMRGIEHSDEVEAITHRLYTARIVAVASECLELSAVAGMPGLAEAWLDWRNGRRDALSDGIAAAVADRASLFRIEDGEPRVVSLGGSLLFIARDAAGARLEDLMPPAQADASRGRILAAMACGEPVLRRHRSTVNDVTILTLPLLDRSPPLALSIARHHKVARARMPAVRPRAAGTGG